MGSSDQGQPDPAAASGAPTRLVAMVRIPGETAAAVRKLLAERAAPLLGTGARVRVAGAVDDDPLVAMAGGRDVAPCDGIIDVTVGEEPARLDDLVATLGHALARAVSWADSAVAVGPVHELLGGDRRLLVALAARRLPTVTPAQFADHWLHVHAPLALGLMDDEAVAAMSYEQLHADAGRSASAAAALGAGRHDYDGVLEASIEAFGDLPHVRVPGFAQAIFEDEQHFADQSAQMRGGLFEIVARSRG